MDENETIKANIFDFYRWLDSEIKTLEHYFSSPNTPYQMKGVLGNELTVLGKVKHKLIMSMDFDIKATPPTE